MKNTCCVIKTICIISIMLTCCSDSNSQNHNKVDSFNKKYGLWKEDINNGYQEAYYENGKLNGIIKIYYKNNNKLQCFGQYKNDELVGDWYYFNEASELVMAEKNICRNNIPILNGDGKNIILKYKSFLINYYPNGMIESEGYVVYESSIELECLKIDLWKYYDTNGKFIRSENREKINK